MKPLLSRSFAHSRFFAFGIAFVGALSASAPARAGLGEWLQEYCDGKGIALCLRGVLAYKCAKYQGWNPFNRRQNRCEMAVDDLVHLLDFDPAPRADGEANHVVFKRKLSRLLAEPAVARYLEEIPPAVARAMETGTRFRLWDHTLRWTGRDARVALEWIAALFQDTQSNRIFTDYARVDGRPVPEKLARAWDAAIEAVGYAALSDSRADDYRTLVRPYPDVDTERLNPGFYHFYFVAHLAAELRARGHDESMAFFAPFLLNSLYEFYEMPRESLLSDPKPFDAKVRFAYKTTDLYSGYVAALWALGFYPSARPFDDFAAELAADPAAAMRAHYAWSPPPRTAPKPVSVSRTPQNP